MKSEDRTVDVGRYSPIFRPVLGYNNLNPAKVIDSFITGPNCHANMFVPVDIVTMVPIVVETRERLERYSQHFLVVASDEIVHSYWLPTKRIRLDSMPDLCYGFLDHFEARGIKILSRNRSVDDLLEEVGVLEKPFLDYMEEYYASRRVKLDIFIDAKEAYCPFMEVTDRSGRSFHTNGLGYDIT